MRIPARTALASTLLALGCAEAAPPARCAYDTAARVAPAAEYRYRVSAGPRAEELCVEVDLPRGSTVQRRWAPEGPLRPFVRDVVVAGSGGFQRVPTGDGFWLVPSCTAESGCRLRYRVLLAAAARALDDFDFAQDHRGALLAPPSSWLLRPQLVRAPFHLAVTAPPGIAFTTGLALASPAGSAFVGDVAALDDTPYAAFGPLELTSKPFDGGTLDVALTPGNLTPPARAALDAWLDGGARALAAYYGRFPIPHAALVVLLEPGTGVGDGHTMGNGGASVIIRVGERTGAADFADDWVLVHELVHVSFPDVGRPWAEEGLATYLEPIIRARAGIFGPDALWKSLLEGLPQGQPDVGDRGLDLTDTWGRRYWGGAMFWLLGDVEIRKRTSNRRSLDDALRAVNRAGGNASVRWDLDRVLALADESVGVEALRPLRERLGSAPVTVDLDALWKSLGVSMVRGRVVYDDTAPLATIRQAIAARSAP